MNYDPAMCREVQSIARGDDRDEAPIRGHLQDCPECRRVIAEIRLLACSARAALATSPIDLGFSRRALEQARGRTRSLVWPTRLLLGTAAAAAAVLLALAFNAPRQPASPTPLVLEIPPPADGGLRYIVHGPGGTRSGELSRRTVYVLDTLPASATVVDTF